MLLLLILFIACQANINSSEPIVELFPTDDMFSSPEAYGIMPADYSEEIPPIHTQIKEINHEGRIEEEIMKEINMKPIFHYGVSVQSELCDDQCNHHGDCQRTVKDINNGQAGIEHKYVPKYICICKDNFAGPTCAQCAIGFFGPKCQPCPRNPANLKICGQNGICDDGIHGTGTCFCKDPNLDPNHYCEYVKEIEKHHEKEEEMQLGFIFLLLVAFLCIFILYAYN